MAIGDHYRPPTIEVGMSGERDESQVASRSSRIVVFQNAAVPNFVRPQLPVGFVTGHERLYLKSHSRGKVALLSTILD
jgi:hypothetical protein